jgi:hypothetical protein
MQMNATASPLVTLLFGGTAFGVAGALVAAMLVAGQRRGEPPGVTRRWVIGTALLLATWLALTAGAAARGAFQDFSSFPPPILRLVLGAAALTVGLALSPVGRRLAGGLSVAWLVGMQAFRIPVEVALWQLHADGVVPVQMTFEGRNFDILTGLLAVALAALAARQLLPTWGLALWNLVGFLLLANIVGVATLSMPIPFRMFHNEPANTVVTLAPFVWLPAFLVQAALFGHLLVLRRLITGDRRAQTVNAAAAALPANADRAARQASGL